MCGVYVSDFLCTYKNNNNNQTEQNTSSNTTSNITKKYIEDDDDDDTLYQIQFLQIFGCEECGYNDDKITKGLIEVKDILEGHSEGKQFLKKAVEIGLPPSFAIFSCLGGGEKNEKLLIDTILRTYYGWNTMDLIHSFVSKIKNNKEVTSNDWKRIIEDYRNLYGF